MCNKTRGMDEIKKLSILFPLLWRGVGVRLFSVAILCLSSFLLAAQSLTPINLTCENQVNPLGIDIAFPGLSLQIISAQRNSSIHDRDDVKLAGYEKGKALVKVGSGTYTFIVKKQ
jgi:hypothetical protein